MTVDQTSTLAKEFFWQLTQGEFFGWTARVTGLDPNWAGVTGRPLAEQWAKDHAEIVAKAVAAGKPVPPEVLAEYPDLEVPADG